MPGGLLSFQVIPMQEPTNQSPIRGRGRPALVHDNSRVQAFVGYFDNAHDLTETMPRLDDVITGITYLQTEGQASTRPLSKQMLFRALQRCQTIDTLSVAVALGREYSRAAIARYTAIARVASKAIERLLDTHPTWEPIAVQLRESRNELDRPYFQEAQALGLM